MTSATTGSPVTVAGANGVLTVTSDGAAHYSWSYTLTQNLLSHDDTVVDGDGDRGAADQKPGEAFLVRATDHEGDVSTTDTLNITVNDDGPTASNDSASQSAESWAFTIAVFGNDVFGADGVDTDNSPAAKVTFTQPAQGVLTMTGRRACSPIRRRRRPAAAARRIRSPTRLRTVMAISRRRRCSPTLKPDSEPTVSVTDGTVDEKAFERLGECRFVGDDDEIVHDRDGQRHAGVA
ncbi:MAG: hypothetical protein MZV49_12400 [Rhodopseudomonas palustris]|nr:hypothetical protein [Rhodopseudomonas palustris]